MIDKYLISNCLLAIDEFNIKFKNATTFEIKEYADLIYTESDLVVRVGAPFRGLAHYRTLGNGVDIHIEEKDFQIQVKYLRNFYSRNGDNYTGRANKMVWEEAFNKDFTWLFTELEKGHKGKSAYLLGWFNTGNFNEIMQLGEGKGRFPKINESRLELLPFLTCKEGEARTCDVTYNYEMAYEEVPVYVNADMNMMFIGQESDVFHFAIYF